MRRRETPSAPFEIARVRLVGFHNFVDETVAIGSDGHRGHLFLLGDNGSGKTTILDAIHLVLTGASEVELNAAARFGGRRDSGRSLAGVVLRFEPSRGVAYAGGATAYAAIELVDAAREERLCLGVGLQATTLDAQVTKWGFVHRGSLESVPLTLDEERGTRATTREELRGALGKGELFARMTDYRSRLAERLFGGETAYEEACRLWGMAKSYREIVAGARDFGSLLPRLLPAPDVAVLGEIRVSLRQLDELEAAVVGLEGQRTYIAGVVDCAAASRAHRSEIARLDRMLARRRRDAAAARLEDLERAVARCLDELARASANANATDERRVAAEGAYAAARAQGDPDIEARRRDVERDAHERERAVGVAQAALVASEQRHDVALLHAARASAELRERWESLVRGAARAIEEASRLPSLLPRSAEAVRRERARLSSDARAIPGPLDPAALLEVGAALDEARLAHAAAVTEQRSREEGLDRAERALRIASRLEADPGVSARGAPTGAGGAASRLVDERSTDGASTRAAFARSGIEAIPLYELIEPRPDADAGALVHLEDLLAGDLFAFVVAAGDAPRAGALLADHPEVRLIVRVAEDAPTPEWVVGLLARPTTALGVRAHAALGALLSQPPALGAVGAADALGAVELRGVALRTGREMPQWLGRAARERARQQDVNRAAEAAASARSAAQAAARCVESTRAAVDRLTAAQSSLRGLESAALFEARTAQAERARDLVHEERRRMDARSDLETASANAASARTALEMVRAKREDAGIDEIARLCEALGTAACEATRAHERAIEQRAGCAAKQAEAAERRDEARAQLAAMDGAPAGAMDLVSTEAALAESGEAELIEARPAEVAAGGLAKEIESLERAREERAQRERACLVELDGDGSRGVRYPPQSSRFGLALLPPDHVEDRRGAPIDSVLAELDRSLAEAREVVNEKTRRLLDTLVMGTLARQLQHEVEGMFRTLDELNRLLGRASFGGATYRLRAAPRPERAELVRLVRRASILDPSSRAALRGYFAERRGDLELGEAGDAPEVLDYRRWFDFQLAVRRQAATETLETELTRTVRALGSGGEQGVPNYLLVLALAKVAYDAVGARLRPLLLDEAFYGIDATRREGLLAFATELGLQLIVASPDQDGVSPGVRAATTLFVAKDEHGDVHLAPYHFWNRAPGAQITLEPVSSP